MPIYENWILKMRKPGLKNGKIFPMTTSLLSPSGGINTCTRGRPPRAWGWSLLSLLAVSRWFRFPLSLVLVGLRMRWFRLSESLVFLVVAMVSLVPRLVLPDPVEIWSKVGISRRKLVAFRVYQPWEAAGRRSRIRRLEGSKQTPLIHSGAPKKGLKKKFKCKNSLFWCKLIVPIIHYVVF